MHKTHLFNAADIADRMLSPIFSHLLHSYISLDGKSWLDYKCSAGGNLELALAAFLDPLHVCLELALSKTGAQLLLLYVKLDGSQG